MLPSVAAGFLGFNFAMGAQGLAAAQGMQKHFTLCKGKIHKITLFVLTNKGYGTVHQGETESWGERVNSEGCGALWCCPLLTPAFFFFFNVDECLSMVLWLKATLLIMQHTAS